MTKIYRTWPEDGFCYLDPSDKAGSNPALVQILSRLGETSLSETWPHSLELTLRATRQSDRMPDISTGGVVTRGIYLQSGIIPALFASSSADFEFLPLVAGGMSWSVVNPIRRARGWHSKTSDVEVQRRDSTTSAIHLYSWSRWLTVIDDHPESLSVFHVEGLRSGPLVTQAFVDRVHALRLQGIGFDLFGEVVTDPSLASPSPARPPPPPPRKGPKLHLDGLKPDEQQRVELARRSAAGKSAEAADIEAEIAALAPLWASKDLTARERLAGALFELHVRIGDLLCQRMGWSWAAILRGRSQRFVAVASADGRYGVSGYSVAVRQLESSTPSLQLLLNLIEDGSQLPPPQPDRVTMLN